MIPLHETIAVIAGDGALPLLVAARISERGGRPVVYALRAETGSFRTIPCALKTFPSPDLGWALSDMRTEGVGAIVLAGRVPKELCFVPEKLDPFLRNILKTTAARDDHSLLGAVLAAIERVGIPVISYRDLIPDMLAGEGRLFGRVPDETERADILYGRGILRVLLPLSFGQTVVVRGGAVVAVEAMEGTDETIRRAGRILRENGRGGCVVKMMRPDQDERYDLPTMGSTTLDIMRESGISCLAVETGRTIVLDPGKCSRLAEEYGISVTGIASGEASCP
jgi:DUF1009 family protein